MHRSLRAIGGGAGETGIRVLSHADAFGAALFATVVVPRTRYSTQLHSRIGALLAELCGATVLQEHLALDERPLVRLHYYLRVPPDVLERPPTETLERP